jgi:hypothetical protein
MKATDRNDLIRSYFEEDMALLKAKGHDYAGNDDCLANLRRFGGLGIIVRLSDKFSRLETLSKCRMIGRLGAVKDESIIDTLRDIRNYAFLLQIFVEGKEVEPDAPLFDDPEKCLKAEIATIIEKREASLPPLFQGRGDPDEAEGA